MGSRCWIQAATSLAFAVHRPSIGVPSSMSSTPSMFECGSKRRVSYFYDSKSRPIKPARSSVISHQAKLEITITAKAIQ